MLVRLLGRVVHEPYLHVYMKAHTPTRVVAIARDPFRFICSEKKCCRYISNSKRPTICETFIPDNPALTSASGYQDVDPFK